MRALLATLGLFAVCVACGEPDPTRAGADRADRSHASAEATGKRDPAPGSARQDWKLPGPPGRAATRHRPPNLVLITLDTVRADALGAYGQPRPTTPEIDRQARRGVLFEQVSTSQPETLPSHSTIFTGLQPYVHGVRANGGFVLSERHTTLAEVLKEAGYATGAEIAAMVLRKETQVTQGFDHYRGAESPDVELKVVRYGNGQESQETLQRIAADISRRGIEFVQQNKSRPFFLWLHYFDAHVPHSAPALFNHKIKGSPYHAEVASADSQVARVMRELERHGLRDDTLVVITADHGEGLGDHGEISHSFLVYESTMRVPLIFSGLRGLPAGRRVRAPVRTADIAPTILDLLGQAPLPDTQGVSLSKLVFGAVEDLPLIAYGESTRLNATFQLPLLRSVREGRWKYIHKVNPELYDLDVDPGELVNLASSRKDVLERLRAELATLLANAPAKPADAQAKIDAETAEQLIALGYVARSPLIEVEDGVESLALPEGSGDPLDYLADVTALNEASGLITRELYAPALERLAPISERNPESPHLLVLTASALLGLERTAEAVELLERAFALDGSNTDTARSLSSALALLGSLDEAAEVLQQARAGDPCNEPIVVDLSAHLRALKHYRELKDVLSSAADACPDLLINLNNYAWALATLPPDALRNGSLAVQVAEGAIERLGERDPAYLDTLAAALAESGDFERASVVVLEALDALRVMGAPAEVLEEVEDHRRSFAARQPLRVP